ncbi:phosphomannomutase/phosphoglucomutase [Lawsonella clevelandensis]|uniref:Phosphomannomutase/phosphoglucomutase n=1 Tax=Lawsonella clevelandensis TaxID=1528099 RepID=A0A5E3ZY13_9ACTN|nr:phosphomannomutase/phosphoglucomutase [Lawsonella clevelandensis]MDU7192699.1 phosphomannomutase/phosphoglucomutase [Lawsonella clevelandensis]VHO01292.1 Phosphomannomutase/phosphoglucomutase [Lawsonella clevelandensis]
MSNAAASSPRWDPAFIADVIKAYDIRGLVGEQITTDFVRAVGQSFGRLMRSEGALSVVVAHDMRDSGPELVDAFAEGVVAQGLNVVNIGLASTDEMYCASGLLQMPGAMFTASHNPAAYNGIKLCRAGARPVGQDTGLATISRELAEGVPEFRGAHGYATNRDMLPDYVDYLNKLVDLKDVRPLTVAVDAGNGMAGYTVPAVWENLPLTVEALYFELDGSFPNHEANPLDPKNLVDLQKFTPEVKADIGVAFDGDADRCFVVDEKGQPVSPSAIAALVAERELAREPGSAVIHNLITSKAVPEIIRENGGEPVRTRVGHSFIKAKMAETNAIFGGEHSAHYYFRDFWRADSGMLAAMHVLAALGQQDKPLSEMMAKYTRYAASGEINSRLTSSAAQTERTEAVVAAFADRTESIDRLDGVTVDLKDGNWFNVRASNTEPLLRLNVEANTPEAVDMLVEEILAIIRA